MWQRGEAYFCRIGAKAGNKMQVRGVASCSRQGKRETPEDRRDGVRGYGAVSRWPGPLNLEERCSFAMDRRALELVMIALMSSLACAMAMASERPLVSVLFAALTCGTLVSF